MFIVLSVIFSIGTLTYIFSDIVGFVPSDIIEIPLVAFGSFVTKAFGSFV